MKKVTRKNGSERRNQRMKKIGTRKEKGQKEKEEG